MAKLFDLRATDGVLGTATLSRSGWVCSASRSYGGSPPSNAINGNYADGWSLGADPILSGGSRDWFKVDCGASVAIAGLIGDIAVAPNSTPTAADLQTSPDDVTYTTVASYVASEVVAGVTTKRWAPGGVGRYFKWLPTGGIVVPGQWWSLAEINLSTLAVTPRVGSSLLWDAMRVLNYTDPVSGLAVPTYPAKSTDFIQAAYATTLQQTSTWFADLYMDASSATASGRIFVIGDSSGGGGPSLRVYVTGATFQAVFHNGTQAVSASTGILVWLANDRIRLRVVLNADGSLLIGAQVNSAAEVTGGSAANTFGGAANQLFLTIGADYNASNKTSGGLRSLQAATGVLTAFPPDLNPFTTPGLGTRRGTRQLRHT